MTHNLTESCGVSIADIGIQIDGCTARLAAHLGQLYREFPLAAPPDFTIQLSPGHPGLNFAKEEQETEFVENRLVVKTRQSVGIIDLQTHRGELQIIESAAGIGADIDNFIRHILSLLVFEAGGLMLHAAGIAHAGRAFVFLGHSGSGKTTAARHSKDKLVLNDDLIVLRPSSSGWMVASTPFWNPSQVKPTNAAAPLARFYRLVQSPQIFTEAMSLAEALAEILAGTPVIPDDPWRVPILVQRASQLVNDYPAQKLYFLPNGQFWSVITSSHD